MDGEKIGYIIVAFIANMGIAFLFSLGIAYMLYYGLLWAFGINAGYWGLVIIIWVILLICPLVKVGGD